MKKWVGFRKDTGIIITQTNPAHRGRLIEIHKDASSGYTENPFHRNVCDLPSLPSQNMSFLDTSQDYDDSIREDAYILPSHLLSHAPPDVWKNPFWEILQKYDDNTNNSIRQHQHNLPSSRISHTQAETHDDDRSDGRYGDVSGDMWESIQENTWENILRKIEKDDLKQKEEDDFVLFAQELFA